MPVFPARTLLQKQFPLPIENEDVDGAMSQVIPMHFASRRGPDDAIHFVDHRKLLLRVHAHVRRNHRPDEICQRDPLLER